MSAISELYSAIETQNASKVSRLIKDGVLPDPACCFKAVRVKSHTILKLLIAARVEVNDVNYWGDTPLNVALKNKDFKGVKILLEAGASPSKGNALNPPLIYSAANGLPEGIKLLLGAGANVDQRDIAKATPLIRAAREGRLEIINMLLAAGADPLAVDEINRTAYDNALEYKQQESAALLAPLSKTKPRPKSDLEKLLDAIKNLDSCSFDLYLTFGMNVNARNQFKWSPLDRAIEVGSLEFVQKLLGAGAEVNVEIEGVSPLEAALRKERPDIAEILFKAGAIPKALNQNCVDPFQTACMLGYLELVKKFLDSGADSNSANMSGETALMDAVSACGSAELVQFLISKGAEVERADDNGWTALFYAVQSNPAATFIHRKFPSGANLIATQPINNVSENNRVIEVVKCLLDHGADVNRRDRKGRTPLTFSLTPHLTQLLIEAGALFDIRDSAGHNVNYWLKKNGLDLIDNQGGRLTVAKLQGTPKPVKISRKRRLL